MNLALPLNLPKETEEQFLPLADSEKQNVITELLIEWADKQARKKRREALLKNTDPDIKKWSGIISEEDIKRVKDERFHDLIAR